MLDRKLAVVDLSKGKVSIEEPSNDLKKAFLGGRGLNSYYLYKHLRPRVNPLSPSNVLIIGTGFLTGTLAPLSVYNWVIPTFFPRSPIAIPDTPPRQTA